MDEQELFKLEEMLSPFDSIKETDEQGREWWNSRKLARLMGYMKYWNFERLMDKVAPVIAFLWLSLQTRIATKADDSNHRASFLKYRLPHVLRRGLPCIPAKRSAPGTPTRAIHSWEYPHHSGHSPD